MINVLVLTGAYLKQHANAKASSNSELKRLNARFFSEFESIISTEHSRNGWFTEDNIRKAIGAIAESLSENAVTKWMSAYPNLPVKKESAKIIGVVMAGNIPLVGFHDMLSVIMSGHTFLGKPSSKDDRLIRKVAELFSFIEPELSERITFTDNYLKKAEAIIATGSNNSARYFEYYFRNIPYIIRKNRNGVALITGNETNEELLKLGEDIFSYFGLGCRNVTKIYIPENYNPVNLLKVFDSFSYLAEHHKYINNIEYNRSVYLMNKIPFLDNGVLLIKEDMQFSSPVGVVYYEKYSQLETIIEQLAINHDLIQCVVTTAPEIKDSILPGASQSPALWNYADGIDTMTFLSELSK